MRHTLALERNKVRRSLLSALTATIATSLPTFLLAAMAVQVQRDLGLRTAALGVLIGAFYASGALSSIASGRFVERVGPQRSLRGAVLVSAQIQFLLGAVASSFIVLLAMMVVAGVAMALAQPASNVVISRGVPPSRLGFALGLQKSAVPFAALLAGLAVPTVALTVGWHWAFVGSAVISVCAALLVPRASEAAGHGMTTDRSHGPDVRRSYLLLLALGVGLGSAVGNGLSAFVVISGVHAGLDEAWAAGMLILGSVAGLAVRLAIGARADRYPGQALRVIAAMFAVASVSFLMLAPEKQALFVIATPIAFATAYAWPGLFHLAVVRSNPSAPAAATGVAMTGTFTGAVVGPVLFGVMLGEGDSGLAWIIGAVMLLVGSAIVAVCSRIIHEAPVAAGTRLASG
jgi:predicted MFS family arabinose efflux permease